MKFSSVTLSGKSSNLLGKLKGRTGLRPNLLARFAICISIKEKSVPNPSEYDKEGSSIEPAILFGEYEQLYMGLMKNRLKKEGMQDSELNDSKINEMTRCHINRGVVSLFSRIDNLGDFYDLIDEGRDV